MNIKFLKIWYHLTTNALAIWLLFWLYHNIYDKKIWPSICAGVVLGAILGIIDYYIINKQYK